MRKILGAAVFAGVVACGGVVSSGDDSGSDGSPIEDASSPYCPSSAPSNGAACSKEGLYCEYGSDPNLSCNTVAQCTGGSWTVNTPAPDCPTPPNPSPCPATWASVPVGQHCGNLVGTTCSYAQGFCGCSVGGGGPVPADASAVATWICDTPEAGCPQPRPRLGTTCSPNNLQCDYSPCELPTGTSIACIDGVWEEQPYGCAL